MSTMERRRRQSPSEERPNMCDLRFVLVGKSETENSRVRNLILHGSEDAPDSLETENVKRFRGRVKDRHVTVIECLHLLNPNISDHQITQTLRECVRLSDPGPHVFILTLQHRDFTEEDVTRVKHVLHSFSEEALRRTIIITTDEETKHTHVHQLMKECGGRHLEFKDEHPGVQSEIFKRVDKMLKRHEEEHLTCEMNKDGPVDGEQSRSEEERKKKSSGHEEDGKHKSRGRTSKRNSFFSLKRQGHQNLNLVLCGSDRSLTVSVSKLLRGKRVKPSHERAVSEVCVKKEEKINGRMVCVVDLPVLSVLSEEEVTRQTLLSVSLCQPGVHAFVIILPDHPLNNDENLEIEQILKIFDSGEHFMVLFTTSKTRDDTRLSESIKHSPESQSLISRCGGQYKLMGLKETGSSRQIPDLLDYIENLKTEPYSTQMYVKAQENRVRRETGQKYEEELKRMEDVIKKFQVKGSEGANEQEGGLKCLRIVLIGRTGSGKSATGNTILGRNEFHSQSSTDSVTTVCEKRVGKVAGRSVSVVDTPGLFDTTLTNEQVAEEIVKCVSLSSPGPHVFVIVLGLGRVTKEEIKTLDLIKKIFGPKAAQFSIVLFTRGDELRNKSIQDYVRESKSAELKKLIRDCGDRYLAFINNENQDRTQVTRLIEMIEKVKNTNQGRFFTNSMFEETEMNIEKIKRKHEEEIQEIKKKHEDETRKHTEEFNESKEKKLKHVLELTQMLKDWKDWHND